MSAANRRSKCGADVWQRSADDRVEYGRYEKYSDATFSHNGGGALKAALAARQTAGLSCIARKRRLKKCRSFFRVSRESAEGRFLEGAILSRLL